MRELAAMEKVGEGAPTRRRRPWDAAGRVRLAGILMTLVAGCLAGYLWWFRPIPPRPLWADHEKIRAAFESFSFSNTLEFFDLLPRNLKRDPRPDEQVYLYGMQWHTRWMGVSLAVLGIGLATIVASLLVPREKPPARSV